MLSEIVLSLHKQRNPRFLNVIKLLRLKCSFTILRFCFSLLCMQPGLLWKLAPYETYDDGRNWTVVVRKIYNPSPSWGFVRNVWNDGTWKQEGRGTWLEKNPVSWRYSYGWQEYCASYMKNWWSDWSVLFLSSNFQQKRLACRKNYWWYGV